VYQKVIFETMGMTRQGGFLHRNCLKILFLGVLWSLCSSVFAEQIKQDSIDLELIEQENKLYQQALAWYDDGNYRRALDLLEEVRLLTPKRRIAEQLIYQSRLQLGLWVDPADNVGNEGWEVVQQVHVDSLQPEDADSVFHLSQVLLDQQKYQGALKLLSWLTEIQPNRSEYSNSYQQLREFLHQAGKNFMQAGNVWFREGEYGRALHEWYKALYFTPKDPILLSRIEEAENKATAQYAEYRSRLRALDSSGQKALLYTVSEEAWSRFPEDEFFRKTWDSLRVWKDQEIKSAFLLADSLEQAGKLMEAWDLLNALHKDYPFEPLLSRRLSSMEVHTDRFERQQKVDSLINLLGQHREDGDYAGAAEVFSELYRLSGENLDDEARLWMNEMRQNHETKRQVEQTLEMARERILLGRYTQATAILNELLSWYPSSLVAKDLLEYATEQQTNINQTQQDIERAQELIRQGRAREARSIQLRNTGQKQLDDQIRQVKSEVHQAEGQKDPKSQANRIAQEESKKKVRELFIQGVGHYRRGDYKAALQSWEAVLELDPEHKQARNYIPNVRLKLERLGE